MKKIANKILLLSIAMLFTTVLFTGCSKNNLDYEHFNQLQMGMTSDEVVKIMGEPTVAGFYTDDKNDSSIIMWGEDIDNDNDEEAKELDEKYPIEKYEDVFKYGSVTLYSWRIGKGDIEVEVFFKDKKVSGFNQWKLEGENPDREKDAVGVNLDAFRRITNGMTYEEVCNIFGEKGSQDGNETMYLWKNGNLSFEIFLDSSTNLVFYSRADIVEANQ